ncbi:hypothetical protein CIW49_08620 [Mycolicibacterium sp. P1-18]|uniref:hypothetical protein n=1 Tax=Mycolicibacterium sp. P1-18 TaxID=2024615 RepID=UPI0011F0F50D|nr:hypothetical protein [Mycolicibacterium sp. P1-18]KAA0099647.1 hypothetical protein CIW49_08620 [Mycolicibacterium sp. P1-18]
MTRIASKGPILTLVAAAVLGIGVFSVNLAEDAPSAAPQPPAAGVGSSTVTPSTPRLPIAPAPVPFPAKAAFHADIPTRTGTLTLDIKVNATRATAYACDNSGIEEWVSGTAVGGALSMTSADGTSRVAGRHQANDTVVGELSIGDAHWTYTASKVKGANDV